jgi:hypothetical protein
MEVRRERAPEVQLECILVPLSEQIRLVQAGELDLALGRAFRLPSGLTSEMFRLDSAHTIALQEKPFTDSRPLAWRTLDGVGIQVPPIRYARQLSSFLEALRTDQGLSFTITPTGSTSLDVLLQQLPRGRSVQLGFDSFRIVDDGSWTGDD